MRKEIKREYVRLQLDEIRPYPNNPRHNEEAIDDVVESIKQCGNLDPIQVDENGVILSGHTRLEALKRLKYTETDAIRYTGMTEEEKKSYTSELDPKFCDVILQRWENYTGKKAKRL